MIGRVIAGRYRVGALLGRGGTAAVHEAEDLDGRLVALKILHPELARGPRQFDAFLGELTLARRLRHAGLALAFDGGVDDGDPPVAWLAMERVHGATVAAVVAARGPLPLPSVLAVADAALAALAAMHDEGVVHRDVTPANIMIDPAFLDAGDPAGLRASVRLLDFGIAASPGSPVVGSDALLSTAAAAAAGVVASLRYASPEHLTGAPVAEPADVYQLAATTLFALTGAPPYAGDERAIIDGHLAGRPPVASERDPAIPREIDRLLLRGLMKDPADRFPDASRMRQALTDAATAAAPATTPALGLVAEATEVLDRTLLYRTSVDAAASVPRRAPARSRGWTPGIGTAAAVVALAIVTAVSFAASAPPRSEATTTTAPTPTPTPTPSASAPATAAALPESRTVPELAGATLDEAQRRLTEAGLRLGATTTADGPSAEGTVLSADPAPGATLAPGAAVALQLASGRNAVPAVTGLRVRAALDAVRAAGFAAAVAGSGSADPDAALLGTDPPAFTVLALGTTVTLLTVAGSPPPVAPTPTPTPTGPASSPQPSPSGTTQGAG